MRSLETTTVAITGASRGIGAATALELAQQGAAVYGCARSADTLNAVAQQAPGMEARALDIRDEEAVLTWMNTIEKKAGGLDVLINNAGVLGPRASLDETNAQAWRHTIDVNINGTFVVTRAAYPLLKAAQRPMIINLSSSVGRQGRALWGAYSVSKFGVEGLAEVAADELGQYNGCVVTLNPGGTATDMRAKAYPDEDPDTLPGTDDVAKTLRLLVTTLTPSQNGAKYSSRDLFSCLDEAQNGCDIPTVTAES